MRSFLLLYILASCAAAQDTKDFVFYGNLSLGISKVQYTDNPGGTSARIGGTIGVFNVLMKIDRTVNNEVELFIPQEKISSNAYLLGYAFQPFQSNPAVFLNVKFGFGDVVSVKRIEDNASVVGIFLGKDYDLVTEKSRSRLVEIDLDMRMGEYVGISWGVFSNTNGIRNVAGVTFGVIAGFW